MTREALICGNWLMEFVEDLPEEGKASVFSKSYLAELAQHQADISANAMAALYLMQDLPQGTMKVVEFFGGFGLHSLILSRLLAPVEHKALETDEACIRHMRHLQLPNFRIFKEDARLRLKEPPAADFYLLDWNSFTVRHWETWEPAWDSLMSHQPQAVLWFDSSRPYFQVHAALYGSLLGGECGSMQDYTRLFSDFLQRRYGGYRISGAAYCPRGTYYLLTRGVDLQEYQIEKVNPGFVWQ